MKLAGKFVNIEYSWSKRFLVVAYSVTEIPTRDIPTNERYMLRNEYKIRNFTSKEILPTC